MVTLIVLDSVFRHLRWRLRLQATEATENLQLTDTLSLQVGDLLPALESIVVRLNVDSLVRRLAGFYDLSDVVEIQPSRR